MIKISRFVANKYNLRHIKSVRRFATHVEDDEFVKIVKSNGFNVKSHTVETNDGYSLKLHKMNSDNPSKKNVLLMHGLYRNSLDYIASGRNLSLAYYLAENKYAH